MTEENSGARVTIRKRSNSGEGAAIGGAEPARKDAAAEAQPEEGRLTAVTFHLSPIPRHAAAAPHATVMTWARDEIDAFFGRAPIVDAESGALGFAEGPWPTSAALATFADRLEADAERRGYRCTCESTLRW